MTIRAGDRAEWARRTLAAAAISMVVAAGGLVGAPSSAAGPQRLLLPDLVSVPPENLTFSYEHIGGDPKPHLLLRFDSLIPNVGPGPLELHGLRPTQAAGETVMSEVFQRIYFSSTPGGKHRDVVPEPPPVIYYEHQDDHSHFHLRDAIAYELIASDQSGLRLPYAKHHAGFCLLDKERFAALGPPYYTITDFTFCQAGKPAAAEVVMGMSPGWLDRYTRELTGQWVDASLAPPGEYRLAGTPNPMNVISEANTANNIPSAATSVPVVVSGYAAEPVHARTSIAAPVTVTLRAARYDSQTPGAQPPGPVNYAILKPPQHGTLSQPTGAWLRGGAVVYVPEPGFLGEDRFTYAARDEDHPDLPRRPVEATATIHVGELPG
jgi:hypothetical protein